MFSNFRSYGNWGLGGPAGSAATLIYGLFIGLPILALLLRAAQQESLWASLSSDLTLQALRLSLITSAICMVIVVLVGTPFARLLARSGVNPMTKLITKKGTTGISRSENR